MRQNAGPDRRNMPHDTLCLSSRRGQPLRRIEKYTTAVGGRTRTVVFGRLHRPCIGDNDPNKRPLSTGPTDAILMGKPGTGRMLGSRAGHLSPGGKGKFGGR